MPDARPPLLPAVADDSQYRQVFTRNEVWLTALRAICQRHSLDPSELRRETLGSHIVFGTEQRIVKLFYHRWADDFMAERAGLRAVGDLPVPQIEAVGELEGWPYLVLSRVPGTPALDLWDRLSADDRVDVVQQLGELMRRLHEHARAPGLAAGWSEFIRTRMAGAAAHHRMDPPWRSWIERHVAAFDVGEPSLVVLHADITEDHVLLVQDRGRWRISALIDFGDARLGEPGYDFIAPLCFYAFGSPSLALELVNAYGWRPTPERLTRLTQFCLLHEFGRVADFVNRHAVEDGAAFERALWGDHARDMLRT